MKQVFLIVIIVFFIEKGTLFSAENKPNFIIFIADDISWDDFGCYGNNQVKTPNIDYLAGNGIKFNNVYLTASSCSPSRNSIMTGRYPHNTGAAELHTQPPLDMLSLPEVLKSNGYFTAHSGKFHMGKYIEKGFDVISREYSEIGNSGSGSWLRVLQERPMDKPFFMWLAALDAHRGWGENQYSGTHDPDSLIPPFYLHNGYKTRKDLAQYYDEIYRFDVRIGEIMEELEKQNALNNTMVIVMADNGRPFPHSKTRVNDRGMKTPFIIFYPDEVEMKAQAANSLISSIDIAPTIAEMAGAEIPVSFQGRSFLSVIENPSNDFRNYVFAEHNWHDYEAHERMVRDKDFMYILNSRPNEPQLGPADVIESPSFTELRALYAKGKLSAVQSDVFMVPRPQEELYDYKKDPQQLLNVASVPEHKEQLDKMRDILQKWMNETGDNIPVNLTKDWYLRVPGYVETAANEVRGEMPGAANNASEINHKGPF
ncbi:MAG: sulfatase [Bacteroidota bacterium]